MDPETNGELPGPQQGHGRDPVTLGYFGVVAPAAGPPLPPRGGGEPPVLTLRDAALLVLDDVLRLLLDARCPPPDIMARTEQTLGREHVHATERLENDPDRLCRACAAVAGSLDRLHARLRGVTT
jgi:hypothetical protein